jgi:hypothetical protein
MSDPTNQVLLAILEMQKQQALYSHRLHGWLIAIQETVEQDDALRVKLRAHPFYDQHPRPDIQITDGILRRIDALIQQLNLQA